MQSKVTESGFSKKYVSVKKNREFQFLFKKGTPVVTNAFVCYYLKNKRRVNRLGIVTSKKIGNAVNRSRSRRVIREAFRQIEPVLRSMTDQRYDFIIVARGKTPFIKSDKLCELMEKKLIGSIGISESTKNVN